MSLIYRSLRVGQYGKTFNLYKLRTMYPNKGPVTASLNDPRLTKLGKILRRYKLDELPTLLNLLKGDISICGPRPDTHEEIESLDEETRGIVMSVRPGIVSPATLWDFNEDEILKDSKDAHKDYCEKIKPRKYRLNVWYVQNKSLWLDTKIIISVMLKLCRININLLQKHIDRI